MGAIIMSVLALDYKINFWKNQFSMRISHVYWQKNTAYAMWRTI